MAKNRLNLDFSLITSDERNAFISAYLDPTCKEEIYTKKYKDFPFKGEPTQAELNTIADYVLYGKSKSSKDFDTRNKKGVDGNLSIVQAGYVEIKPRKATWSRREPESLDAITASAANTGNPFELQFGLIGSLGGSSNTKPTYRQPKMNFSREACRAELSVDKADAFLLQQYEDLWKRIDILEYTITAWEIRSGKRTLEIRQDLLDRLTDDERLSADQHVLHLNMYAWSKLRKLLVELRQEQYTMRDGYKPTRLSHSSLSFNYTAALPNFTNILPCGVKPNNGKVDLFMTEVEEEHFDKLFQDQLINFLIEKDIALSQDDQNGVFDFRNPEHIALLVYARADLIDSIEEEENIAKREEVEQLLDTLDYYVNRAKIEPFHRDIIQLKSVGLKNQEIADQINSRYNKIYSSNYISTIFYSKCCSGVSEAAKTHWEILEKISLGIEEFKRCNTCGLLLLRDSNHFVKKARSADGLAGRCKICDKISRQMKKGGK